MKKSVLETVEVFSRSPNPKNAMSFANVNPVQRPRIPIHHRNNVAKTCDPLRSTTLQISVTIKELIDGKYMAMLQGGSMRLSTCAKRDN